MQNKEALNDKIDMEAKSLTAETKSKIEGKYFSEYEVKWALRNTFYTMNMTDDTITALMAKDNILDDVYKFCSDKNKTDDYYDVVFVYLEKAEHDYLADKLYDRVKAEYEIRLDEIRKMSPDKIIGQAYELVILEDTAGVFEFDTDLLSTEQLKGLMSCENPLWSVYHEWQSSDFSHMDDIRFVIKETASEKASEIEDRSFEPEPDNDLENEDGQEL